MTPQIKGPTAQRQKCTEKFQLFITSQRNHFISTRPRQNHITNNLTII